MKKVLIISIIIFIVVLLIGLGFWLFSTTNKSNEFKLINTNPVNNSKNISPTSEITFNFSNTLSRKENANTIETSPSVYLTKEIRDNQLILKTSKGLRENTQYIIKLSNIESIKGQKINPITLIFSTGEDTSPKSIFIEKLPYQGDGFYIEFDSIINTFIVTIQKSPYDQYKQNAINYLKDNRIDINTEKIQFQQLRYLEGKGAPPI